MIYTLLTKKAMKIAFDVHKNQTDKSSLPYIFHPILVANEMEDEITTCVALLHDVIEDGNITLEFLKKQGFNDEIVSAIDCLTHDESVPYMDYIAKIKNNEIAKKVKLADLKHNSDVSRLDYIDEKAIYRMQKYKAAIAYLTNENVEKSNEKPDEKQLEKQKKIKKQKQKDKYKKEKDSYFNYYDDIKVGSHKIIDW